MSISAHTILQNVAGNEIRYKELDNACGCEVMKLVNYCNFKDFLTDIHIIYFR